MDIPAICDLMEEAHATSKYKKYPLAMDRKFKPLVMESIRSGNGCVFISTTDDKVTGFIIGAVDDLYHVLNVKYATDMFFYVTPAGGGAGVKLLNAFISWARGVPGVVRIRLGSTNAVGDYERTAKLFERKGLTQEGVMHEMEIAP